MSFLAQNLICTMLLLIFSSSFAQESGAVKKKTKEEVKAEKQIKRSQRAMWIGHILREKKEEKRIQGLEVEHLKVPVFLVPKAESFRPLVKLKLKFERDGWALLDAEGAPVKKGTTDGEYVLYAYLNSRISTVGLKAQRLDQIDEISQPDESSSMVETMYVFAPEAREFKTVAVFNSIQFYAGHSYLVYNQKSFGRFVSQSLLLGAKYISPEKGKKIGYLADISSTVYTYESSPLERTSNFLEARAAGTYKVKLFKDPKYRSRFFAGVSTINLFSLGASIGFSGLYGPNLGLRTEYYKSGVTSYLGEIQFTPYEYKKPLSERTLKLSFEWNKNLDSTRRAQIGFSYSNSRFTSGVDAISADLLSLYYGMSF